MAAAAPVVVAGVGFAVGAIVNAVASTKATASAKETAEENLDFEKEQFEYEKELQETTMEREDTAIQRQVADSRAAGISPLVDMTGSQSSGATGVALNAPHKDYVAPATNVFQALFSQSLVESMGDLILKSRQVDAQTDQSAAMTSLLNQSAAFNDQANPLRIKQLDLSNLAAQQSYDFNGASYQDRLDAIKYGTALQGLEKENYERELDFRKKYNLYDSFPDPTRLATGYGLQGADGLRKKVQSWFDRETTADEEVKEQYDELVKSSLDLTEETIDAQIDEYEKSTGRKLTKKQRDNFRKYMENTRRLRADAVDKGQL